MPASLRLILLPALAGPLATLVPAAAPAVEIIDQVVAVKDVCAWPKLALLPNGDVVAAVYNQPSHGARPGEVDLYASADGGRTWTKRGAPTRRPAGAFGRLNHALGVARDGAVHVVSGGWEYDGPGPQDSYKKKKLVRPEASRSIDGGRTWKFAAVFPDGADGQTLVPFGNVETGADGALRVAAYSYNQAVKPRVDVCYTIESRDQGQTWTRGSVIGRPAANETDLLHLGGGRWLAAARNLGRAGVPGHAIDVFASDDDARTWRLLAQPTTGNQHPGDLLKLADGRVLLVYGDRRPGHLGVGAMLSADGGRTWSDGVPLTKGLATRDSGYPSSVQLRDGTIVTGYYAAKSEAYPGYQFGVVRWRLAGTAPAAEAAAGDAGSQVLFQNGDAGVGRYRIPNVHVTGRGTVLAYAEAREGRGGDGTPADLVLRRSLDAGRSWSEPQVVVRHADRANLVFPLVAEERKSGTLFFFYAERAEGLRGTTRNFLRRSADEGRTWSEPVEVTAALLESERRMAEAIRTQRAGPEFAGDAPELYGREIFVFGPGRPVQLSERHPRHPGRLVVPVFAMKDRTATPRLRRGYGNAVLVSDDRGATWRVGGTVPIGDGESSEVTVVELPDGALLLNSRQSPSERGTGLPARTVSVSRDGGDTWTRPRRDESGIPSYAETHSCLLRLTDPATDPTKTGRLLFSFPAQNRTRGTILLSYDEHGSWPVRREIVAGPFSYSNLAVLPDESVLLIYEGGAPAGIHLRRFTLEWLTDGRDSLAGGPRRRD